MSCKHGMDGRFCALCNGACLARPDGHPVARPDAEPRFAKGRDSAKWVGYGQSLRLDSHAGARACAAEGNIFRRGRLNSAWLAHSERQPVTTRPEPLSTRELSAWLAARSR